MKLTEVGKETFTEVVLNSNIPVLVDYYAPHCGPCRVMAGGVLEKLAPKYADQVKIVGINVEDNYDLAIQYEVISTPTLKLFKDGMEVESLVGTAAQDSVRLVSGLGISKARG